MKIKHIFALFSLLFLPCYLYAEDISLEIEDDDPAELGAKSLSAMPSVMLENAELFLSYPLPTESQVILIDQSTQTTVYSETFAASRSIVIDLAEEGLEEGTYELHVYAFGKWWWGEFEIIDN